MSHPQVELRASSWDDLPTLVDLVNRSAAAEGLDHGTSEEDQQVSGSGGPGSSTANACAPKTLAAAAKGACLSTDARVEQDADSLVPGCLGRAQRKATPHSEGMAGSI